METEVQASQAFANSNGGLTPSLEENEELYNQLLQLRDLVVLGQHPQFKLPAPVIERLRSGLASSAALPAKRSEDVASIHVSARVGGSASSHGSSSLPGLSSSATSAPVKPAMAPASWFSQGAPSPQRAEADLRRQRIEADLIDPKTVSLRKDEQVLTGTFPMLDIDRAFSSALNATPHVSGIRETQDHRIVSGSSFDENDYYSSQFESDWSSHSARSRRNSNIPADAFTAGNIPLDNSLASLKPSAPLKEAVPSSATATVAAARRSSTHVSAGGYGADEENDNYSPPEAVIDHEQEQSSMDESSDYEPGEITTDSNHAMTNEPPASGGTSSRQVRVVQNQLTHIAAPQPNRLSSLAGSNDQDLVLKLVDGRPEAVPRSAVSPSSSASQSSSAPAPKSGGKGKKRLRETQKKRKANSHTQKGTKRGRGRTATDHPSKRLRMQVKHEPNTPPPFAPDPPSLRSAYGLNTVGPGELLPGYDSSNGNSRPSALERRQGYPRDAEPGSFITHVAPVVQPRVPRGIEYSPTAPYLTIASNRNSPMGYQRHRHEVSTDGRSMSAQLASAPALSQHKRQIRGHTLLPNQIADDSQPRQYGSVATMPPPQPSQRYVFDQYGNRYYHVGSAGSTAAAEQHGQPEQSFTRGLSRMSITQARQSVPVEPYDPRDHHMLPVATQRLEHAVPPQYSQSIRYHTDDNGQLMKSPSLTQGQQETVVYNPEFTATSRYRIPYEETPSNGGWMSSDIRPASTLMRPGAARNSAPIIIHDPVSGQRNEYVRVEYAQPKPNDRQDMPPPQYARATSAMPSGPPNLRFERAGTGAPYEYTRPTMQYRQEGLPIQGGRSASVAPGIPVEQSSMNIPRAPASPRQAQDARAALLPPYTGPTPYPEHDIQPGFERPVSAASRLRYATGGAPAHQDYAPVKQFTPTSAVPVPLPYPPQYSNHFDQNEYGHPSSQMPQAYAVPRQTLSCNAMPEQDYGLPFAYSGASNQQPQNSQQVKYVDQHGRELSPSRFREAY